MKYREPNIDFVKWNAKKIESETKKYIRKQKNEIEILTNINDQEKTWLKIKELFYSYERELGSVLGLLVNLSPKEEIRAMAESQIQYLDDEMQIMFDNPKILEVLLYAEKYDCPKKPHEIKMLRDSIKSLKHRGLLLSAETRKKLLLVNKNITELSMAFDKTITEDRPKILFKLDQLKGVPEEILESCKKIGKNIEIDVVSAVSEFIFKFCEVRKTRNKVAEVLGKTGGIKNLRTLEKLMALRHKRALLLGFANHVDFGTDLRMAKNSKNVEKFLIDCKKKHHKNAIKDRENLVKKGIEIYGKDFVLERGDNFYLTRLVYEDKFKVNERELITFLPYSHVRDESFKIFGGLFGINFKKIESKLWHKDVEYYSVFKKGIEIARVFLDVFSRQGKQTHSGIMFGVYDAGLMVDGYMAMPMSGLMMNILPAHKAGEASYMTKNFVETFFHEWGHMLHSILGQNEYQNQSGTNVDFDFVETPSQFFENYLYTEKTLKAISRNVETGKSLDTNTINDIINGKKFQQSYIAMRGCAFAWADLKAHSNQTVKLPNSFQDNVMEYFPEISFAKGSLFPASFGHMNEGMYAGGYYGYAWAEENADKIWGSIKNPFSKKVGKILLEEIYSMGSMREEIESMKSVLSKLKETWD